MDNFLSDFGVTASASGQTFTVIIDKATHFRLGMDSIFPTIVGVTADMPSLSVGDAITVDGVSYQVAHPPLLDSEMTTIALKDGA
jgi:hypothetical protein